MTQDERELLLVVADAVMVSECNIPFDRIRALIRKIREDERAAPEPNNPYRGGMTYIAGLIGAAGCICPPSANATCANLHCPRKPARRMQAT